MSDTAKSQCNPSANGLDAIIVKNCLDKIKNKLVVMSGKGGVGKSTVAVNLAMALAMEGYSVGLLDVDLHGPSVPKMLHLEDAALMATEEQRMIPVSFGGLKVMSVGFLLRDPDEAVVWRGPVKMGVIKQFITDVEWGELDYLVVDVPPGTGDEPLTICQLLGEEAGAVIVTSPQQIAAEPQIVFNSGVDYGFDQWASGSTAGAHIICSVNTAQAALDLASAGVGIALIPEVCAPQREDVRCIPVSNWHQALYMCILYDKWLEPPVWSFVEQLVHMIRKNNPEPQ